MSEYDLKRLLEDSGKIVRRGAPHERGRAERSAASLPNSAAGVVGRLEDQENARHHERRCENGSHGKLFSGHKVTKGDSHEGVDVRVACNPCSRHARQQPDVRCKTQ
jgi:hypothetical protein